MRSILGQLTTVLSLVAPLALTRDKISKANCCQGDDDKIDGLERAPSLDVFEYDSRQSDEEKTAEQNEEKRGDHADLRLTHVPLLKSKPNRMNE